MTSGISLSILSTEDYTQQGQPPQQLNAKKVAYCIWENREVVQGKAYAASKLETLK